MRLRHLLRLTLLVLTLLATSVAVATSAQASSTVRIKGGDTALTVDQGTLDVLTANKVAVTPIRPAKAAGRTFAFPIVRGRVDAATLAGTIDHSGGLQFAAGQKKLGVQDFVIDTRQGVLTARVSGTHTRIPLLKLDLSKAHVDKGRKQVVVDNVTASLTAPAAAALNKTFGVTLFTEGLKIGVAKVTARV